MKTALLAFAVLVLSNLNGLRAWKVCCPGLPECFTDDPPYQSTLQPQCAESLSLNLKLYNRKNPLGGEEFSRTMFPPSFKEGVTLMFIVHGSAGNAEAKWLHNMKDAVLEKEDYNVVIVGWKGLSKDMNFVQSAADTRTVGAEIALLAKQAIEKGALSREKLYCVGYCHGAEICGHAGNSLKFGRITGLDPSALYEDRDFGLQASSADFVDVIHTHGQLYNSLRVVGLMKTVGHVDFYPNGGQVQPGCDNSQPLEMSGSVNYMLTQILNSPGILCNHARVIDLFMESILTPCFVARYSCADQFDLPKSCTKSDVDTQNMGFSASPSGPRGIFYLTTNGQPPYCQG